jgi:hypothetical protein
MIVSGAMVVQGLQYAKFVGPRVGCGSDKEAWERYWRRKLLGKNGEYKFWRGAYCKAD